LKISWKQTEKPTIKKGVGEQNKNNNIMKKLLLLFAIGIFMTQLSFSQVYVEEQNINELDIKYIELVGVNTSMFGVKMKIYVDYGAKVKFMKSAKIKGADGKIMKFNTMIHALNFMYDNGWEYVNYSTVVMGGKIRTIYILKKKN